MDASAPPLPFAAWVRRLITAERRGRAAHTVEIFGWVILAEGSLMLLAPALVGRVLGIEASLAGGGETYLRLAGLLVGGLGMLYVVSGRVGAEGFVFASLLDRPLVPPIMALLWTLEVIPGALALLFAVSDGGSFLWTLAVWRSERRAAGAPAPPRTATT